MMNEWGLASPDPTFGQGTTLQSACPAFPSAPEGYVVWNTNVNGAVPADVQARAVALTKDPAKTLGYTETIYSGGVPSAYMVDRCSGRRNPRLFQGMRCLDSHARRKPPNPRNVVGP